MSTVVIFWILVVLFAVIGAMRGWAKEVIVAAGVIFSLFIITLMEQFVPPLREGLGALPRFWARTIIILLIAFFAYQVPNIRGIAGAHFARERVQDTLLGLIIGALNGYLIVGSLWFYMDQAGYPFAPIFPAPSLVDPIGQSAQVWISRLPPVYLQPPWIYFAIVVAILFAVAVFIEPRQTRTAEE